MIRSNAVDEDNTGRGHPVQRFARVGAALVGLFMLVDALSHIANFSAVRRAMTDLGYPAHLTRTIGVIELGIVLLYLVTATRRVGILLLTAYLGGAVATNLRADKPLLSTILFPCYVALVAWGALLITDSDVRRLLVVR